MHTFDRSTIRQRLLTLRRELLHTRSEHLREESALLANRRPDWLDAASEQWDATLLDRLSDHELTEIKQIQGALERLEAGSYGACVRCGDPIAAARLADLPATPHCTECSAEASEAAHTR